MAATLDSIQAAITTLSGQVAVLQAETMAEIAQIKSGIALLGNIAQSIPALATGAEVSVLSASIATLQGSVSAINTIVQADIPGLATGAEVSTLSTLVTALQQSVAALGTPAQADSITAQQSILKDMQVGVKQIRNKVSPPQ